MDTTGTLPRWLPSVNRLVHGLNRLGLAVGPVQVLTVPGRVSGGIPSYTGVPADRRRPPVRADQFAAAADRVAAFRLDRRAVP